MLGRYRMELVSAEGSVINSTEAQPDGGRLLWHLGRPGTPGHFWVRVSDPAAPADLLREFGLDIR